MNKIWVYLYLAAGAALTFTGCDPGPRGTAPNLLLITLDTTRADRLGCYGYGGGRTPALDGLAASGCLFEQAFTPVPITLPSHVTMMTGLLPPEHGVRVNGERRLGAGIPTLAEILQRRGYATAAFIASATLDSEYGLDRGFDVYDDDEAGKPPVRAPVVLGAPGGPHRLYLPADEVVDSALAWLRERAGRPEKPFFCWVHLFDPHAPRHNHADIFTPAFPDAYDAEVAFMDLHIRRLLSFLSDRGLREKTLVVAVGDHGEGLGEHGERTHGFMLYSSTLRVPLIFAWPGRVQRGIRVPSPVSLRDLFSTIISILGVDPGGSDEERDREIRRTRGGTFAAALSGHQVDVRPVYGETDQPYYNCGWSPLRSLTTSGWKYIRAPRPELYDRTADREESRNLAGRDPGRVARLEAELEKLEASFIAGTSPRAALSPQKIRSLESLGYLGEGGYSRSLTGGDSNLADVKDKKEVINLSEEVSARMGQGDCGPATIDRCRRLVDSSPDTPVFHYWLGLLLAGRRSYGEARTELDRSIELFPREIKGRGGGSRYLADAYEKKGLVLTMEERYAEAEPLLRLALQTGPETASAHDLLGFVLLHQNRLPEARDHFLKALRIDPEFDLARRNLAVLEEIEGR